MSDIASPTVEHRSEEGWLSFDLDEVTRLKEHLANARPYGQRLCTGLVIRLLANPWADAPHVLRAIDALEGFGSNSNVKPASQFKHAPLAPLWHQHYFNARHMLHNIGLRWGIANGGAGNRDFDGMISDVTSSYGNDLDLWPRIFVQRFADGYIHRSEAGRLTGDWIIFALHDGQRYYLDLATHEEGEPVNAAKLVAKLRGSAAAEFPFVFEGVGS